MTAQTGLRDRTDLQLQQQLNEPPTMALAAAASKLRMLKRFSPVLTSIYSGRISPPVSNFITSIFTPSGDAFVINRDHIRRFGSDIDLQGPAPVDYGSLLPEDEYNQLADYTIQDLLEKFEEYGDSIQIDGFDIDYGNQVLTLKLGAAGTYVLNKQTPNRQLWLSSPISGPSRFDWDKETQAWIYRRTKANLYKLFETELEQLCGSPINVS